MDEAKKVFSKDLIEERIGIIRETMRSCARAEEPVLLPVTKTYPAEIINWLPEMGICEIGENRVQEILAKVPDLRPEISIHQIGQLQTNKVRSVLPHVKTVQSVDRVSLVLELQKQAKKSGRILPVLLEVNTSLEPQKGGVSPEDLPSLFELCLQQDSLRVCGLMTVAPNADPDTVRTHFRKTREWFEALKPSAGESFRILSMGMSSDYRIALEEGSTMIRVGSAIFGQRS
ncbi:MAG: YggS family pyridoxal phosphate-dependent enzyme [Clostridia bacterium]|nr:YggS family pyridoxal phosphate-dependent enzyme [Clostridia bacterium]